MISFKPFNFLDGFGERVEASGATRVCVPSFIVFLAVKIATLSSLLILLCALRVSRRNLLRRKCLDAVSAFTSAQGRRGPPPTPFPPG